MGGNLCILVCCRVGIVGSTEERLDEEYHGSYFQCRRAVWKGDGQREECVTTCYDLSCGLVR